MREQVATVAFQREGGRIHLNDLWFMVGSRCNLRCIHCYVDSSPENDSLEQLTLQDVRTYLEEASRFGMRSVYFTGGEPFINRDIIAMLGEALKSGEVTALTNATTPIVRYLDELETLHREFHGRLIIRVSMDHYVEARHDAIRGKGMFRKTVENTVKLRQRQINVIVTVTPEVFRGNRVTSETVSQEFKRIFLQEGVELEVKVLPAVLEMGAQMRRRDEPSEFQIVSEERLEQLSIRKEGLMCYSGRSILKRNGECRVYPCPIIYEVPEYDLGATIEESFQRAIPLTHRACSQYCCVRANQSTCTN
ncbi:radical SAM protein [bacterium]|nr:radical SAM protein [bacterium]